MNRSYVNKSSGSNKKKSWSSEPVLNRPKNKTERAASNLKKSLANLDDATSKYTRGDELNYKVDNGVKFKKLKKTLLETHESILDAASRTASTEVLLSGSSGFIEAENDGEKTYRLQQKDIKGMIDANVARSIMNLQLPHFGPYSVAYSRNGRSMVFAGAKGHISVMNCQKLNLDCELQLQDTVHDVCFLHNEKLFAAAQNKYTYIYDDKGMEIHCMKKHERTFKLDFLPYHYLLTTVGNSGWVKWQDISIGEYVAGFQTGFGPAKVLKHNPQNAVSFVGHSNGVVSLWSPASGKSLVSMFCHKAPVSDICIDKGGNYMASAGADGLVKIWDLRTYKCLHKYTTDHPVVTLDVSDTGLLAMGMGRSVQVLKGAFAGLKGGGSSLTYLKHSIETQHSVGRGNGSSQARVRGLASSMSVTSVRFRPYEDVLCMGHSHGVTTLVVPGAGEANYDALEANPYASKKEMQEAEVQTLLNKLPYTMISLDPSFIGSVDKDQARLVEEHRELFSKANDNELAKTEKNKKRGRNKISAKLRRKQKNVIDAQGAKLRAKLEHQRKERQQKEDENNGKPVKNCELMPALQRFNKAASIVK